MFEADGKRIEGFTVDSKYSKVLVGAIHNTINILMWISFVMTVSEFRSCPRGI